MGLLTKITDGVDSNFYQTVAVSITNFGPDDRLADVGFQIRSTSMSFYIVNGGANPLHFSFNGNTLHGIIPPNSERLYSFRAANKIWFAAPGGATTASVEAWPHP